MILPEICGFLKVQNLRLYAHGVRAESSALNET